MEIVLNYINLVIPGTVVYFNMSQMLKLAAEIKKY